MWLYALSEVVSQYEPAVGVCDSYQHLESHTCQPTINHHWQAAPGVSTRQLSHIITTSRMPATRSKTCLYCWQSLLITADKWSHLAHSPLISAGIQQVWIAIFQLAPVCAALHFIQSQKLFVFTSNTLIVVKQEREVGVCWLKASDRVDFRFPQITDMTSTTREVFRWTIAVVSY